MFTAVYQSILPTAIAHGITTEPRAAATLSEVTRDIEHFPARPALWPLLIGAWKRKPDKNRIRSEIRISTEDGRQALP